MLFDVAILANSRESRGKKRHANGDVIVAVTSQLLLAAEKSMNCLAAE